MKKLLTLFSASLTAVAMSASAQEAPPYENWVGGFAQYYNVDSEKGEPNPGLDDGRGFGAEFGFRFDPSWAVRFELGRILINTDDISRTLADDGTQIGADVLYFLENDAAYFFGGLREQSITDSYRMATVGIGKHWAVSEDWRVITELAKFHDFGQGYNEFSAKLGLAYIFGKNAPGPVEQPDSDGDGVYDAVDRCPTTLPGTQVDATGCNIDLDGDGVFNSVDQCPRTPSGVEVDATGCEVKDSDNDGVVDADDKCPSTPAGDRVDSEGCSVLVERQVSIELDILFPNNSSVISNPDSQRIEEFVAFMRRYPNTKAEIQGHTSSVGSAEYNQVLSERRANSVKALLISEYGIEESRLTAVGYGESRLRYTENTAEAHRLNRRIEASVTTNVTETEKR